MARAVLDSSRSGSLSRRANDPEAAGHRVLKPTANRLIGLDPRLSVAESVRVAIEHGTNFLLAELVGSAVLPQAAVRATAPNVGRTWARILEAGGVDFAVVEV